MSETLITQVQTLPRLDYSFLRRVFFGMGAVLVLIAPSVRDPLAFAVGGMVPWLILSIVGIRTMPAAVPYILLWQWLQIFARTILTLVDGERIGGGLFGSSVERAYWYMLASVVVLACVFRFCLNNLRKPTLEDRLILYEWRPNDLFIVYLVSLLISSSCYYAMTIVPALGQQFEALLRVKALALFVLFTTVLTTGVGLRLLVAVVAMEIVVGFSGLLSDFREVFIFVAIAALAARIRWTSTMTMGAVAWFAVLIFLALFWTSVKAEFRQFATRSDESQKVRVDLDDRLGYLGGRALNLQHTDWGGSAYMLLARLAYVDIFGSVITVADVSPEGGFGRQWSDAFEHVMKPRVLFPDKAALSDTEVYMRLAHGSVSEEMRLGTSISVGYMAENFADFGFPGMLVGVAAVGLLIGGICRFFMSNRRMPWAVREGIVVAYIFTVGRDGVEISLPKILGGSLMFFVVYAILVRFFLPSALRWLNTRAEIREPQLS
jgi:hypothetical protein